MKCCKCMFFFESFEDFKDTSMRHGFQSTVKKENPRLSQIKLSSLKICLYLV